MVKLELTIDQFHAIINLLATIPANNSYYIIKLLKDMGDSQVETLQAAAPDEQADPIQTP